MALTREIKHATMLSSSSGLVYVMVYSDGHSWVENYYNDSIFSVSDDKYGGSGSFYLLDGNLHWYNDQTGEETVFVPA